MPIGDFRTRQMIKYLEDSGEGLMDALKQKRMTVGQSTLETLSGVFVMVRTCIPVPPDERGGLFLFFVSGR
ncbi:hypothetical protein [Methanoregula sp.]|uniref:hypothetical protein n=1 Tax=Methanoregula sp. TaxID=2052170 RepID=UPI00261DF5B1|nr:hypothetical protein [Methanoregula sp.]MDD5143802.1 hypothetical protein [Methanoregula sp.]